MFERNAITGLVPLSSWDLWYSNLNKTIFTFSRTMFTSFLAVKK